MRWGACVVAVVGACSDDVETARASLEMTSAIVDESALALPIAPPHCQIPGVECLTPTEFSIKLGSVYLAEDTVNGGVNAGRTAAIYGNPTCELYVDNSGITNPNFGTCSIDLGLKSTAGQIITSSPAYLDFAQSPADLKRALEAGHFSVPVGTYRFVRLDLYSNATSPPPEGTQDTLPAGTAMNVRFFAAGMVAPYEIRQLIVRDVGFKIPLEVTAKAEVIVDLQYDLSGVVYSMLPGTPGTPPLALCTATPTGNPAKLYCVDSRSLALRPVVVLQNKPTDGKWDGSGSLWDSENTLWGP